MVKIKVGYTFKIFSGKNNDDYTKLSGLARAKLKKAYRHVYGRPGEELDEHIFDRAKVAKKLSQDYSGAPKNSWGAEINKAYSKAFRNRYDKIKEAQPRNQQKWEVKKRYQKSSGGQAYYPDRRRVRYTGTGLYTGYFRDSLERNFLTGGTSTSDKLRTTNLLLYGAFSLNIDSFPKTTKSGSTPYPERYLSYLASKGVIKHGEKEMYDDYFRFADGDRRKILSIMKRAVKEGLIGSLAKDKQ